MIPKKALSRRTMLRGLGVAMALPYLEAMGPLRGWSENESSPTDIKMTPNRMAFLYVPNGIDMDDWTPATEGANFECPSILKPLESLKSKFNILTGLTADKARSNGDGPGDHARALASFLTGCQPRKTDGTNIRAGVSVDQVAAAQLADRTRLPSLEIGCEQGAMAGNCDSGYSCVYSSAMAWRSATQPLPKEIDPKVVFERMFSNEPDAIRVQRDRKRRSILDFVREDSKSLSGKLGSNDVRKLDEYFSSVRDIESRIERAEKMPPVKRPDYPLPTGVPKDYAEHLKLMSDLMVLAFQADVTRVCTFVFANEGSNRGYGLIGVPEGHHDLSHHGNDQAKKDKIRQINTFHAQQLSYLLERLNSITEGDGTLLDHSMIAYGSGNSDGNRHNHDDLPILLAGSGCGTIATGRHIRYPKETPLNNLWLAMLERIECRIDKLGDSTGVLSGLNG